jgi:hypothetical protein
MTRSAEYRQYAYEAMQSASRSRIEPERLTLLALARTWAAAALASEQNESDDQASALPSIVNGT